MPYSYPFRPLLSYQIVCCAPLGDEDNGEQGAWFVLSALGLFSTVPGSPHLVLGSPIFRHVRVWRGYCTAGGQGPCDYGRDGSSEGSSSADAIHFFPADSSYLDLVTLGTSAAVSKVVEVTLDGAPLPPSESSLSSPSKSRLLFQGNVPSPLRVNVHIYMYMYVSVCVCVCVCVCL